MATDYQPTSWVDDDGSGQAGTVFNAAKMNHIEQGIADARTAATAAAQSNVGPPVGYVFSTASVIPPADASYVAVPGLTYTIPVGGDGTYQITAILDAWVAVAGQTLVGYLYVNGVQKTALPALVVGTLSERGPISQQWTIALVAGDIVTIRVGNINVANGATIGAQHSSLKLYAGKGVKGDKGDKGDASNAAVPIEDWHILTTASVENYNGSWKNKYANNLSEFNGAYRKDPLGICRMRGIITGGKANEPILQLTNPAYFPAKSVRVPVLLYDGVTGNVGGAYVNVTKDGLVQASPWAVDSAPTAYIDLSSVWWDTNLLTMPAGPKGDPGQGFANAVVTWDWNQAIAPGVYRSGTFTDGPGKTINSPPSPDPLNPTMAIGFTLASGLGDVEQFAYVNEQAYSRLYSGGAWTLWLPFLRPGKLSIESGIGGTPYDGEIRFFQDATLKALGVCWQFRYNAGSASPYKWEFVGGAKWNNDTTANVNCASNAQLFGNPLYTLPLSGDFAVSWGARMFNDTSPYWGEAGYGMEWLRGGVRQINVDYIDFWSAVTPTQAFSVTPHLTRTKRFNGFGSGDVIRSYFTATGAEAVFANIWMEVVPVRVSGI